MIYGKKINIRPVAENDLIKIHEWSNNQFSSYFLLEGLGFASLAEFNFQFNEHPSNELIIETNTAIQQPIGLIKYVNSSCSDRRAELLINIFEMHYFKRQESFEAIELILKHLFYYENLERVYSYIFEDESELLEMLEKVGFKKEGQLKEQSYFSGRYHDLLVLGILKKEFVDTNIVREIANDY